MTTEPIIICPNCTTEIKLTESLAAPLIQTVRKEYEAKIEQKEADVAKRESAIRAQQETLKDAQKAIDEQVADQIKKERAIIAEEEAKKAKRAIATDLEAKSKEVSELQDILEQREGKLKEAQKAQADLLRKQRELDDAKRELELTIEKRVQESTEEIRQKAKQEAEEGLRLKGETGTPIISLRKTILSY